jgi:hypothetical protein
MLALLKSSSMAETSVADPGFEFFHSGSRILGQKDTGSGTTSNLSIFNLGLKYVSNLFWESVCQQWENVRRQGVPYISLFTLLR